MNIKEETYGGYNIPSTVWMEERRKELERAFNFAQAEREEKEVSE